MKGNDSRCWGLVLPPVWGVGEGRARPSLLGALDGWNPTILRLYGLSRLVHT